jgi:peroxiredoxin
MPSKYVLALVASVLTVGAVAAGPVQAPVPQPAAYAGVGRFVPDLSAKAIDGTAFKLSDALKGKKAAVVAVTSSSCPLSKKYLPTLAKLEQTYATKGVAFVLLAPTPTDEPADLKALAAKAGLKAPIIHDADGGLCKRLGACTTTDVFILDAKRTVVYRGAIDDQYGIGYSTDAPKKTYAADALAAVLAGAEPKVKATTAPGCALDSSAKTDPPAVTYHNRVSRIVQQSCLECHRQGGVGPFSLATRAEILAHKGMIKQVVADGRMPPWHAAEPKAGDRRPFVNDCSLPEADKVDLLAWIAAGGPEGDPADAPLPRTFPDEWHIGKPDLIVQVPEPIEVKATGVMKYQNRVVDLDFPEDKWVTAAEIQPTDKSVVHHVLVFVLRPITVFGRTTYLNGEGQGFFAAYVPGNTYQFLPEGFGRKIPKGSKLRFQIHYTPNGTATEDRTRVGFKFADGPPKHELLVVPVAQPKLKITPGASDHEEVGELPLADDAVLTAISPHMHVRGKKCRYEAVLPDGTKKLLLDVPHYDFNWQHRYQLAEPVALPKDTILRFTVWYDNSSSNPANPDPKAEVKWGPQTFDEMLIGYTELYRPNSPVKAGKR